MCPVPVARLGFVEIFIEVSRYDLLGGSGRTHLDIWWMLRVSLLELWGRPWCITYLLRFGVIPPRRGVHSSWSWLCGVGILLVGVGYHILPYRHLLSVDERSLGVDGVILCLSDRSRFGTRVVRRYYRVGSASGLGGASGLGEGCRGDAFVRHS